MNGFQTTYFKVATKDGRNFVLLEDVRYVTGDGTIYILPAGMTTDGASTPDALWITLPPFGTYWQAAVLHDAAYRNTLLLVDRQPANLTEAQANELLKEAMSFAGVSEFTAWEIYSGVCLGGASSFAADRAAGSAAFMQPPATLEEFTA